ncbi:response regulator [Microbaculum marinum]|uniref:Response regulator n=1 Tax=Microbaculum marinum TaxID=1764581 RepID=A0AAW9RJG1_9HYPH
MAELAGLRVLVVEDEGMVALLIEGMLADLGCDVVASAASLSRAVAAARDEAIDFALLDVNLDGHLVFPAAEILRARGIPFVFSTGYGRVALLENFKEYQVLNKPFAIEELREARDCVEGIAPDNVGLGCMSVRVPVAYSRA